VKTRPLRHPRTPGTGTGTTQSRSGLADRPAPILDLRASVADSRPPGVDGRERPLDAGPPVVTAGHINAECSRFGLPAMTRVYPLRHPLYARRETTMRPSRPRHSTTALRRHSEVTLAGRAAISSGRPRMTPRDPIRTSPGGPHNVVLPSPAGATGRRARAHPGTAEPSPANLEAGFPTSTAAIRPVDALPPHTDPPGRQPGGGIAFAGHRLTRLFGPAPRRA